MKVSSKVLILAWRVVKGILPCRAILQRLYIPVDEFCPVCGCLPETTMHILYSCPFAQSVWLLSSLGSTPIANLNSWFAMLLTFGSKQQ